MAIPIVRIPRRLLALAEYLVGVAVVCLMSVDVVVGLMVVGCLSLPLLPQA